MKLTLLFLDNDTNTLRMIPTFINKHSANITQDDIDHEIKAVKNQWDKVGLDGVYVGAVEGFARKFAPAQVFTLDDQEG